MITNLMARDEKKSRSFSALTGLLVALIFIGAGVGIGIGVGAGIWKDSGTDGSELDWFFSQQADGVRVSKATPDSDVVFVTLDGLSPSVTAISSLPYTVAREVSHDVLAEALSSDPGKNAMLVCDNGEEKLAMPFDIKYGYATDDEVNYIGQLVPFNNGTWSRVDEGKVLSQSSVLSSFAAGETVEFNSSCYLFIDGLGDFLEERWENIKENPGSFLKGAFQAVGAAGNAGTDALGDALKYATTSDEQEKQKIGNQIEAKADGAIVADVVAGIALGGAAVAGSEFGTMVSEAWVETIGKPPLPKLGGGALKTRDIIQFMPK